MFPWRCLSSTIKPLVGMHAPSCQAMALTTPYHCVRSDGIVHECYERQVQTKAQNRYRQA
jgi:hypothetical protein